MWRGNPCPSHGSDVHGRCSLHDGVVWLISRLPHASCENPRSSNQEVATFLRHVFENAGLGAHGVWLSRGSVLILRRACWATSR
jgi:hypothetical protein